LNRGLIRFMVDCREPAIIGVYPPALIIYNIRGLKWTESIQGVLCVTNGQNSYDYLGSKNEL
jgi:hypothetical protein